MFSSSTTKSDKQQLIKIELVKKGDFARMPKGKEVYKTEGYCRLNKKYCMQAESDISKQKYLKKGTIVEIGFNY